MKSLIAIAFLVIAIAHESASAPKQIEANAIYKIFNKADTGVLTAKSDPTGNDDLVVKVKTWDSGAGQKWKSKQRILDKSFKFRPTSNSKADLDSDSLSNVFARESDLDSRYWYVKDMGEGGFQIKNYLTSNCLASQGLNRPVKLMSCDNSSPQQWTFTEL